MCFHGNQISWGINHSFISLYSKYQPPSFICSSIMLAPVISSLDEIYCICPLVCHAQVKTAETRISNAAIIGSEVEVPARPSALVLFFVTALVVHGTRLIKKNAVSNELPLLLSLNLGRLWCKQKVTVVSAYIRTRVNNPRLTFVRG